MKSRSEPKSEIDEITQIREPIKLMTQDQFLELLTNWIRANKQTSENLDISADTELLGTGLLDSFDFLDLIVHIESKTGRKIDLAVADPSAISVVRGLCSLALSTGTPMSEQHESGHGSVLAAGAM
jgi:acyl carrier protein